MIVRGLLFVGLGLLIGWFLRGALDARDDDARRERLGDRGIGETEPTLRGDAHAAAGGWKPSSRRGDRGAAAAGVEGSAEGAARAAALKEADLAGALALVRDRDAFSDAEIEAVIAHLRVAQERRHKRAFNTLFDALLRSKHPRAVAFVLRMLDGQEGEHPHNLEHVVFRAWRGDEAIDLVARVRAWLGLTDAPELPGAVSHSFIRYLMARGDEADRVRLLEHDNENIAVMATAAALALDPARSPALYEQALADPRLSRFSTQLFQNVGGADLGVALDFVEKHIRAVDRGEPLESGHDAQGLIYRYALRLRPDTFERGARFIASLQTPLLQVLFLDHLKDYWHSAYDLSAFEQLGRLPARVLRRVMDDPRPTAALLEAWKHLTTLTIYEDPPLLNEENVAALEAAAQHATGDEARRLHGRAVHYRQKLQSRPWR